MPISDRHDKFVAAYLAKPDQTAAAITAGYSPKTAKSAGHKLMLKPAIKAAIEAGMVEMQTRFAVDGNRVLQELVDIGLSNIHDFLDQSTGRLKITGLERGKMAAVKSITVDVLGTGVVRTRLDFHDKLAALDKLCRHLGLYKQMDAYAAALEGQPPEDDAAQLPMRDTARQLLLALSIAMKANGKTGKAAPAAPPTKH